MAEPTIQAYPRSIARNMDMTGRQDISSSVGAIGLVLEQLGIIPPSGVISAFAGSIAPNGYMLCDGSAISRENYIELFNVIGTTYGVGDGSTTFNLPNLKGKVVVCRNSVETEFDTLGETGGSKTHTLTIPEMPSHNHNGLTQSAGTHTHVITDPGHAHAITDPGHNHATTDPGHSHSYFNQPQQHEVAVSLTTTDTADNINVGQTTGTSTTGITINTNTTGISINTNTTGITNQTAGAHQHIIDSQGGDQPHNNLQPYIVLNYIIKL
jgi:microcystin-dependent protein